MTKRKEHLPLKKGTNGTQFLCSETRKMETFFLVKSLHKYFNRGFSFLTNGAGLVELLMVVTISTREEGEKKTRRFEQA